MVEEAEDLVGFSFSSSMALGYQPPLSPRSLPPGEKNWKVSDETLHDLVAKTALENRVNIFGLSLVPGQAQDAEKARRSLGGMKLRTAASTGTASTGTAASTATAARRETWVNIRGKDLAMQNYMHTSKSQRVPVFADEMGRLISASHAPDELKAFDKPGAAMKLHKQYGLVPRSKAPPCFRDNRRHEAVPCTRTGKRHMCADVDENHGEKIVVYVYVPESSDEMRLLLDMEMKVGPGEKAPPDRFEQVWGKMAKTQYSTSSSLGFDYTKGAGTSGASTTTTQLPDLGAASLGA